MSLALIGNGASYEFRWRRWALLRDTAATHLEGGKSGARFPQFASIGDALVGSLRIPAAELAREIDEIRKELGPLPMSALTLGEATARLLYIGARPNAPRALTPHELSQIAPVGSAVTLEDYFVSMFDSIATVCRSPADDGTVEAIDG